MTPGAQCAAADVQHGVMGSEPLLLQERQLCAAVFLPGAASAADKAPVRTRTDLFIAELVPCVVREHDVRTLDYLGDLGHVTSSYGRRLVANKPRTLPQRRFLQRHAAHASKRDERGAEQGDET